MNTEYKTLTHLGQYVDANLLTKGIYTASQPYIYPIDTSIDLLITMGLQMKDMAGNSFINEKYFESLKQCQLTPIFISQVNPSELLKQNKEMREMLDFDFVKRMQEEMKANEHKGDWKEFSIKENRPDILREIEHHYNKLVLAFESDDDELIREHSADIGNIAMFMFKSTEQFLTPKN